jgi:Tfp pilus assembly protein PilP
MRTLAIALLVMAACGGDDAPPPKAPGQTTVAAPTAPPPGAGSGKQLPVVEHAENRVICPQPKEKSKKCDPNVVRVAVIGQDKPKEDENDLVCNGADYCLPTSEGFLCGACPERDQIRHVFQPRDFVAEQNRDPFQGYYVKTIDAGSGSDTLPKDTTARCPKADQLQATSYAYADLKLVGIVAQGTQRKVLLQDPGGIGNIIKRGDCVGKEKAWVKEIGENFVCVEITADATSNRPAETRCSELHPKTAAVGSLPTEAAPQAKSTTITPVVAPPPTLPARTPTTTTPTTKTEQAPPVVAPPTQAPTTLKP